MMGVLFSEDRIDFRGKLTTGEIKQIVRNGGADTILPVMLNLKTKQCAFFTSSSKKNKEFEELASKYDKKYEANTNIVRQIIFPDGRM